MTAKTINSGVTYGSGFTIIAADGNGFALTNNGVVGSTTVAFGVFVGTTGDFVYNAGKILASTASGDGIFSNQSVRITNKAGGLINGSYGIALNGGGTIVNASGGSITGRDPIYASTTSVYVSNQGGITGSGTSISNGGVVLNAGGYVYNKPNGSISGANGVLEGVFAKVRNEGTITGNNDVGVLLKAGGTVTSETQSPNSAATISGSYGGISITGGAGYVLDADGQISGGVAGVFLQDGGYIHQIGGPGGGPGGGTITANYAVAINNGPGTVETGGRILGTKLGVGMDGAGPHKVTLSGLGATISGAKAISISGGSGYIYNHGTINGAGGTAVILPGGYNNVLEIYSGAKVYGQVNGGNFQDGPHTTTLLLGTGGANGTLTGFGSRYYNIGNVTVKSGAVWSIDSLSSFIDPSFVSAGSTTFLPVTLLDVGTLTFAGSEFSRLTLGGGAHLTVSKSGVMTPAYASVAIYAATGTSAPLVVTDGQVTAAGNDGIRLDDGGTVTNQSDGTISAQFVGVRIQNAKGTVTNSGLIKSAITYGIALGAGGSVTNTGGSIAGTLGVGIYGGAGTVTNTGRISGSGSNDGVLLKSGGTVVNQAGTIIGLGGIFIFGGAGTVTNYGQITGTGIYSVNLSPGFANRLRIAPGASFSGSFVDGGNTAGAAAASTIELLSTASAGTINGIGSAYKYFSDITVDSGAAWTIASGAIAAYQTLVDSGTATNDVFVASAVTLANGTFTNANGGYLFGSVGIGGVSGTNVVVNNGNIRASGLGVSLATAGRVTNQSDGFIGGKIGIYIEGSPASVVNQGLIEGYMAVYLPNGGAVDNQGGLISGRLGVVIVAGNGTLRNAGTIVSVGDYGVILPDAGADRLVLVPGSTIAGLVHGGLAGSGTSFSTLELASGSGVGTIGGVGSKYLDFKDIAVDLGATWTLTSGQTIAATQPVYDNGTLTNSATVRAEILLGSGAVLTNASGGTVSGTGPVLALNGLAGPETVVNYGLIDGGKSNSYGVELLSGGSVTNRAGTITSSRGVVVAGHAGTVTNTGTIAGSSGTAVALLPGFQNRVAMSPGAVFTGKVDGGNISASSTAISTLELMTAGSAGVTGTLSGLGSQYVDFQSLLVDPGATWTVAAGQQIPPTYTLTDNGTLINQATVLTGVTLGGGASVTNAIGAKISSASDGALALGSAARVVNFGTLQGASLGVSLIGPGAAVINRYGATILGGVIGASVSGGPGSVTNYGLLVGGGAGVVLSGGGSVFNVNQIAGIVFGGVSISGGAGTVGNYGTIAGGSGTAVALAAGFENRVIVGPGAVFAGRVNGGNAIGASRTSTLELTGASTPGGGNYTGKLAGLGGQYINFSQIAVDAGASWLVTGNPTLAAGITLTNSGALAISSGALSVVDSIYNNDLIQENAGTLTAGRLLGTGEVVIGAGSTLLASGSVGYGQTIAFTGAGLLALVPGLFSGQIDGLRAGGTIELSGITDATLASIVNGNTLAIVQSAGPTIDLILDPATSYAGAVFPIATLAGVQFVTASAQSGPTVINLGETISVTGADGSALTAVAGGLGGVVVTGAGSLLKTTGGAFIVGDGSLGSLAIQADGSVTAQSGAIIANTSAASGSSISLSGSGSNLQVTGSLVVGAGGDGSLQISSGASVTAGTLDLAAAASGDGSVSVSGSGSALTVTGSLIVGDQSSGEFSILGGAHVTIGGGLVGGTGGGGGNVDVEDAGSLLTINGGTLVVGANGPAEFTLGIGATLKGEVATSQFGVTNFYGNVDPATDPNDGTQNVGFGNSLLYDFYVANSGTIKITSGTATFYTPLVTFETNAQDGSANGLWVIGAKDTLVMNATSVDNSQTLDFTSASAASLVIGQVPASDINNLDTLNGATTPTLTGSIAAGAANVLPGWNAPIENYQSGDVIRLQGLTYGSATVSGDVVTVWSGAAGGGGALGSLVFIDKSDSTTSAAALASAAAAQVQINSLACFAAGTRIATDVGLVAVERLRIGDEVLTARDRYEPIVWIGHRAVNCARHPKPETVWPVRIARGAFGENVPNCDLYLSPDHAVFVKDVLIPVKLLTNGTSIVQVRRDMVTYHHIELPEHSIVLAEGLPVESYLDTRDRDNFDGDGAIRLFPDFAARLASDAARIWETKGAARLVMAGDALNAARRMVFLNAPPRVSRLVTSRAG